MDKHERTLYGKEGFTVIELMIVVVIILVLCAFSVPSMQQRSSSHQENRQGVAQEINANKNRITPAMLRQQRQETAMVLQAVQAELRDEIR